MEVDNQRWLYAEKRALDLGLTERQAHVAAHIATGLTNRAIGEVLEVSEKTVKYHTGNIYKKVRCRTRLELALILIDGFQAPPSAPPVCAAPPEPIGLPGGAA